MPPQAVTPHKICLPRKARIFERTVGETITDSGSYYPEGYQLPVGRARTMVLNSCRVRIFPVMDKNPQPVQFVLVSDVSSLRIVQKAS